jgi:hypothetical protein
MRFVWNVIRSFDNEELWEDGENRPRETREPLEFCRLAEAELAARTGVPITVEDVRRIERRDAGWVIVDPSAGCLFEEECSLSN